MAADSTIPAPAAATWVQHLRLVLQAAIDETFDTAAWISKVGDAKAERSGNRYFRKIKTANGPRRQAAASRQMVAGAAPSVAGAASGRTRQQEQHAAFTQHVEGLLTLGARQACTAAIANPPPNPTPRASLPRRLPRPLTSAALATAPPSLQMGIVGLPNVGKSTLFNTLTKLSIPAENFPFCTIDPNNARVTVPDARFDWLVRCAALCCAVPRRAGGRLPAHSCKPIPGCALARVACPVGPGAHGSAPQARPASPPLPCTVPATRRPLQSLRLPLDKCPCPPGCHSADAAVPSAAT